MKKRAEVSSEDQWNVAALYRDAAAWEEAFKKFVPQHLNSPIWPSLQRYKGTFDQSAEKVKEALVLLMEIDRELTKLYTYAHLKHDEDIADPQAKRNYEQIMRIAHIFAEESAWFQPELLALSEDRLHQYLSSPLLADYRFYLEKMIRMKKHTLSPDNERLIALAGQPLQTSHKAFSAINDADFKFGSVQDAQGNEKPLTHGTYGIYIREQDRLCELLNGQMQSHLFQAKARNFNSCLEAALYPKNIDTSVYHALIQAVHEKLDVLHRYMKLRKKVLKLDELHLWDIYVPLTASVDIKMSYPEAENIVIESVAPLGQQYQEFLKKGFLEQRWVDRYENQNKRSGAYSSGCFDSMPYILMNYKNILRDVFTLAHEAGHSMHSLYSRTNQPYQYADYPIFLAEVASTFNEDLLTRLLISRCTDKNEKIFLINQKIEDIRGTLFRQTMFAEFELKLHEWVENGIPLTPELLKEEYSKLNQYYFGPDTVIDPEIDIEWARIPHFYYNFYVFQYATGISAALALSDKVKKGNTADREAYLNFLKSGSSKYPIETLQLAGIDMRSPAPVKAAIESLDKLTKELEKLLES
jgi:oligoendopeptidase F